MHWRQRNVQKKRDVRAKLLFCQSKLIAFLTSSLTSTSSLPKLPIRPVPCERNVILPLRSVKRETSKNHASGNMNYRAAKLTWALTAKSSVCLSVNKFASFFFLQMITGGIEMEGVYRVNGGQLTMKKLKTAFDQGKATELWLFIRENVTFSSFISDQVSTEFRKSECKSISSPSERKNKTSELLEAWHQARSGNTWAVFYS